MIKQEEIREGLYLMRFKGRYGKSYKLSYPDVDEILSYLHSQGVVIKVERELPECPYEKIMVTTDGFAQEIISYRSAQQDMLKEVNGISFKAVKEFKE